MIFVGEDTVRPQGTAFSTTLESEMILPECSTFSSQTSLDKKTFDNSESLSSERSSPLTDIQSELHNKAAACVNCKPARSDSVLGEASSIKQALEVHRVPGKNENVINEKVTESVEMDHTGVTPVELNENLLNTLFKFNPMSRLKSYLISKTGVEKTYYSLLEILTVLKDIIRGEGMFDHSNPSVILCSQDLEEALNMRALHVTEIRDLVLSHLTRVPDQSLREKFSQQVSKCRGTVVGISRTNLNTEAPTAPQPSPPPRIIRTAYISTAIFTDKNAEFTLKQKFLKVVRSVPGTDQAKAYRPGTRRTPHTPLSLNCWYWAAN